MMRHRKILIGTFLLGGGIGLLYWLLIGLDSKTTLMKTETPVRMDVVNKRVISGKLVPHKEVALKTEIAGILDKLYVSIGDTVTPGAAIARIKVLPKSSTIEEAKYRLHVAQIAQKETAAKYQRRKQLFQQNMLSQEQYEAAVKDWELARAAVNHAQKALDFVLRGHITGTQGASNTVRSTIAGIVSELPCKEGSVVTERSNMQEGSNIATISDMRYMLFQGQVGEMDVGQLHTGMQFEVSLLAVKGKKLLTTLTKISPKALREKDDRSIRFAIEGTIQIKTEDKAYMRAGYTAMAEVVLDKAVNVLAVKEQCIHTETEEEPDQQVSSLTAREQGSNKYFVWVYAHNQQVKKPVELGVSDGLYVEIKQGLTAEDQVIVEDDSY